MRMTSRVILTAILLGSACLPGARQASAQDQDANLMMPDQSAALAKKILQQAVEALGGSAYLGVRDVTCTGRLSQFGHSGELSGFEKFIDFTIPPDKDRTENLPKRNIIQVFNGDKGWVLDRGGVSDAPENEVHHYVEDIQKDLDNVLRNRVKEPNMIFRYAGPDIVDLKESDWVELVDTENRTIRIAIAKSTHLPVRKVVETRDPNTRLRWDEIEYYSNYHPIDGVETPFQITRERNGIKIYQVFFDECHYNTSVSPSLFTKESLQDRWEKLAPKSKKK
jgi:hypothetical protein